MTEFDLTLARNQLSRRTFLLGSGSGFVVYLPVAMNIRDRTLHPSKWFGAAGFGRHYLSALRLWVVVDGNQVAIDRTNECEFTQGLCDATRRHEIDGMHVREKVYVPHQLEAAVITVEADGVTEIVAEPQFDMRYYQAFDTDFSAYRAGLPDSSGSCLLWVTNSIPPPTSVLARIDFAAVVAGVERELEIELLPLDERLHDKVYLADEHREKAIHGASRETHVDGPDEAPIWDQYETRVFAPARIRGASPLSLVLGFGSTLEEASAAVERARASLGDGHRHRLRAVEDRLQFAGVSTGNEAADRAYAQVLTRFDQCLVARDMEVRTGRGQVDTKVSAILAGNKYFLDPWKRDENISLGALLSTGDFETVRAILDDTWRYQDPRTGRLPQIMRLGEKLVYFSSDGTLWALQRLHEYTRVTGDRGLLEAKYPLVEHFFKASLDFVRRGLLPSGGIVDSAYLWETWMDTPYTPRDGYPVEIELLWLTNLAAYLPVVSAANPKLGRRLEETLGEGRETFRAFYLDGYLADSLSYEWETRTNLTPNGYMAFGLSYPLPEEMAEGMLRLGREQLAGRVGIRSLAPRDWAHVLSPEFTADPRKFHGPNMASVGIYNYHRGVEWLWLNQFFVRGELEHGDPDRALGTYLAGQVHAALHESGVGGLSELYDIHGPLGADFQAWSMAGFVEAIRAFGGVEVDAGERVVTVRPSLPRRWPHLRWKTRIGGAWLALEYRRNDDGGHVLTVEALDTAMPEVRVRAGLPAAGASRTWKAAETVEAGGRIWTEHVLSGGARLQLRSQ